MFRRTTLYSNILFNWSEEMQIWWVERLWAMALHTGADNIGGFMSVTSLICLCWLMVFVFYI